MNSRNDYLNPAQDIADPEEHERRWRTFVHEVSHAGRIAYESGGLTPAQLGNAVHNLRHGRTMTVRSMNLAAFAYELRLKEVELRTRIEAAVALHMRRTTIFEFFMSSEFGLNRQSFEEPAYEHLRQCFDSWLAGFGPSVLEHRYEKKEGAA